MSRQVKLDWLYDYQDITYVTSSEIRLILRLSRHNICHVKWNSTDLTIIKTWQHMSRKVKFDWSYDYQDITYATSSEIRLILRLSRHNICHVKWNSTDLTIIKTWQHMSRQVKFDWSYSWSSTDQDSNICRVSKLRKNKNRLPRNFAQNWSWPCAADGA